jgi:hypothetical protein
VTGIVLAGGPMHGRRLAEDPGDALTYLTAVSGFTSIAGLWATRPPRPSWWRHPLAWRRWRPEAVPVPDTTAQQHLYRRNGTLADGTTAVFWWVGRDSDPPPDLDGIICVLAEVHRRALNEFVYGGWWEMGGDWYNAIRRVLAESPGEPALGDRLLGREVRVTVVSPRIVTKEMP